MGVPISTTNRRIVMNAIYTVLAAFALGYLIRSRGPAVATYLALGALVFGYQTLWLVIEWVNGSTAAFGGPFPGHTASQVYAYGAVNLIIFAAGVALVLFGTRVRRRRSGKREARAVVAGA